MEHRLVPAATVAGIRETVELAALLSWYHGAFDELSTTVRDQGLKAAGPSGGLFSSELFQYERGEAILFIPVDEDVHSVGRVEGYTVPGAELAITTHRGPHTDIDTTYGALGAYVTLHALMIDGPVREYYVVDGRDTTDPRKWRTEIGWPIFQTVGDDQER